jgi:NitT/TauT family transport system permease protein
MNVQPTALLRDLDALVLPVNEHDRRGRTLAQERVLPKSVTNVISAMIFVALVIGWEVGTRLGWIDTFFWSSPSAIASAMEIYFSKGTAVTDTIFTFEATLLGFVFGTLIGALLGLSFWWSKNYAAICEPYIVIFNAIPKVALAPLLILVFGLNLPSKVALAIMLTSVITALSTISGVRAVDPDLEKLMYSLGAGRMSVFRKVVVPSCLPWIISSLRVTIGFALAGAITAEFISSQFGLGRTILYASNQYDMALVWDAIILLSVLAMILYTAVIKLEKVLLRGIIRS